MRGLFGLCLVLIGMAADASQCVYVRDDQGGFSLPIHGYEWIFEGRVTRAEGVSTDGDRIHDYTDYDFQIERVWQAPADGGETLTIRSQSNAIPGDRHFKAGHRYLVFLKQWEGRLMATHCAPTIDLDDNSEASIERARETRGRLAAAYGPGRVP